MIDNLSTSGIRATSETRDARTLGVWNTLTWSLESVLWPATANEKRAFHLYDLNDLNANNPINWASPADGKMGFALFPKTDFVLLQKGDIKSIKLHGVFFTMPTSTGTEKWNPWDQPLKDISPKTKNDYWFASDSLINGVSPKATIQVFPQNKELLPK